MPKKAKNESTLRRIREISGLTQSELAATVGCSFPVIQSLEAGKMRLSRHLAVAISDVLGCAIQPDDANRPYDCFYQVLCKTRDTHTEYTQEFFETWRPCGKRLTASAEGILRHILLSIFARAILASHRDGKLPQFFNLMMRAIHSGIDGLGLHKNFLRSVEWEDEATYQEMLRDYTSGKSQGTVAMALEIFKQLRQLVYYDKILKDDKKSTDNIFELLNEFFPEKVCEFFTEGFDPNKFIVFGGMKNDKRTAPQMNYSKIPAAGIGNDTKFDRNKVKSP